VTVVGVIVDVALSVAWGMLFAAVAREMRGLRLAGAAFIVASVALAVDLLLGMRVVGGSVSDVLAPAQVVALHVVLGVALGVGMRLATSEFWSN
jgi:hypothetical protein